MAVHHFIWARIRAFATDVRGVLLPQVALISSVILTGIGVTIDTERIIAARTAVASATDAAALAAGRAIIDGKTTLEAEAIARAYFTENTKGIADYAAPTILTVTFNKATGLTEIKAQAQVTTVFFRLTGVKSVTLPAFSQTRFDQHEIELSMVLDVTGSMAGQKITDLKAAAGDVVDILLAPDAQRKTRIGLVPFADGVNAGTYAATVTNNLSTSCVHERAGSDAFTDAAPDSLTTYLGWTKKMGCPSAKVQPLTSDSATLKKSISALSASGGTAGHLGIAWGWYLVSPKWTAIWPAASAPAVINAEQTLKAVLVMTDGDFNTQWVTANGSSSVQAAQLCTNMKAQGYLVYTVAFQAPSAASALLKTCSSGNGFYFSTSTGASLRSAFQQIAKSLSGLRVTK